MLEFILILLRMIRFCSFKKKNYSNRAFWGYFFGNGLLQCVQKYDAKALEQSLFLNVPIVVILCGMQD